MDNASSGGILTDDQAFLLYFIIGTYFAPDLKAETPPKSVFQRHAECLSPYISEQLAGSHIKAAEVERIYYYVLRKADPSVIVKLPILRRFFFGNLPTLVQDPIIAYPQFDDLFPPHLHPHSRFKNKYNIIGDIVFINNPETYFMNPADIERFKRLTGLRDLYLDRDSAIAHMSLNDNMSYNVVMQEVDCNGELPHTRVFGVPRKTRNLMELAMCKEPQPQQHDHVSKSVTSVPHSGTTGSISCNDTLVSFSNDPSPLEKEPSSPENFGPGMIFLPSQPTKEVLSEIVAATAKGSALTGTAAAGQIRPIIGAVDIGECEDSYLFRVSLPGVRRDEREFGCEVENDGKVLIRGVTVGGEKTVCRYSQTFKMLSQNLCPPGHFAISFKLPGPVDPEQFSGNFGTDGILEGVVMKEGENML